MSLEYRRKEGTLNFLFILHHNKLSIDPVRFLKPLDSRVTRSYNQHLFTLILA